MLSIVPGCSVNFGSVKWVPFWMTFIYIDEGGKAEFTEIVFGSLV
jgi:hypothetical protein